MAFTLHYFGIRHHGPGSARSLRDALADLKPDAVLIEGPPDAADLLPLAADESMRPPVALLIYHPDRPKRAVFYPFATFSPEWVAIRHALDAKAEVRFMDLPVSNRFALFHKDEPAEDGVPAAGPNGEPDEHDDDPEPPPPSPADLRHDPLHYLALAAGDADGERWWDRMVESRRARAESGSGGGAAAASATFAAVHEAMTALRAEFPKPPGSETAREEDLREAHMRRTIRAAIKEGFQRIAVVCGAWHTPALADLNAKGAASRDNDLLAGLPKVKTKATWIPWTHGRLCAASGYGAGVQSPGWYDHLWTCNTHVIERWMTRVARLLREKDLDASSAHIIESVRLAESLSVLRGRALPGLDELNEATESVFTFGNPLPLRLIHDKLIIGEVLGQVPESAPAVPLQRDLEKLQSSLRLRPSAEDKTLDLDLRNATDLARSHLLHRLRILDIPWGNPDAAQGRKAGTFHEYWRIQWQPEFAISIVEAGAWGNTVAEAASALARHRADAAPGLAQLTELLDDVLLAELPEAADHLTARIASAAAVASDVGVLMAALPALARVLRYGNVRKTDAAMVEGVLTGLVARICVGLPPACLNLNDDAAAEMLVRLNAVNDALATLARADLLDPWRDALRRAADTDHPPASHPLLRGRAWRILLDSGATERDEVATRMSLALSRAAAPAEAAAWLEGFLAGSGLVLLHDRPLWDTLDAWVTTLKPEAFDEIVPLLRRAFATFPRPERRQMGELVKSSTTAIPAAPGAPGATDAPDIDLARAELVLPTLDLILGPPGGRP